MVKSIILMRHAEREDRAQELEGKDWISTAPRPQDPVLSARGRVQAENVGKQLKNVGVTRILSSPMIRTVITSDIIAEQLNLGPGSVNVEMGLVEEAKSFRGKTAGEPRPNWSPLILPVSELKAYSDRINDAHVSLHDVRHEKDDSKPNTVSEVHAHLTDRDEITRDRCRLLLRQVLSSEQLRDDVVLLVGHGATVLALTKVLELELPEEHKIQGSRNVSCFAEFQPVDPAHPDGPWKAVTGVWSSGEDGSSAENEEDKGFAPSAKLTGPATVLESSV